MIISLIIILLILYVFWLGYKHNQADWGHWFTNIFDGWIRIYCNQFHRMQGQKLTLPKSKSIILAANHISGIDPFILITALNCPVRFMIAKEEYEKPILHWMFKAAGCIPVDRGGRVEKAFRSALKNINKGELVALFPQGGIHSEVTPRNTTKAGIVKLAQLSESEIYAVKIDGVGAPGTVFNSVFTRSNIQLTEHPLISVKQASGDSFRKDFSDWLLGKTQEIAQ